MEGNKLTKIEKFSSYRDKVYAQIKQLILQNTLKPGDSLLERDIAEQLGVSRTPVREALKLLEHEGWVHTVPWKGVFVRDLSDEEVKDIIELRIAIETYVIREITNSIPDEVIDRLSQELEKSRTLSEQGEYQKAVEIDQRFHFVLADMLHNKKIVSLLTTLRDQIMFLGMRAMSVEARPAFIYQEHAEILDALRARNADLAMAAMERHLKNILGTIISRQI
ncbi:GntR family transcriptional regulator [Alicyclobacillus dauci]|uniref:GntR family transcriptional regulator n=1 Tax=Alicyclobacillus dauci TaxID=1475485 RepID=A0ABY6Z3T9_9BACL|nr:GntR family transcriptional regulator [Alicyclobacillus dauci]WAH37553.1 GntR family transcriptional regulator [Alicyclobacillus dauci]